ncbi:unnamed protein product [Medioppia subpectinata]|uniref:Metalloendopeptidase n=1 Tax=Medioppia subpectinata TaxID=1979941 RepID=A0A7R9LMK6_9ACAR|nr:unnamed protein product [Medioppia subpectinata]CAG2120078.1 unnamed protein product [Medioppia subpectinata]
MGYIPYVIGSDLADKKSLILEAMNRYHQNTCIRFMERTTEYDYIYLAKVDGCSSYVGRIGGKQLLSLSDGCHNVGTIVHELGHVVGFYHEHQRSDRDQYLEIYTQNIRANYEGQFTKLGPNDNRLIVPFDFNSIMLYGPLAFSKDSISKTMGPKAQYSSERMVEVNEKYGLSKLDITAVQKLYQC